ncbi:glutamine-hydrolyzing carbamoyl-phosphate synthase small subunit [Buchnera aphidicola]|uniref:glutamine-hydrolyzing carbamoyl-phosphate synthase small subunit n=1 Tax=Buchnera aphidicola TaxID=9 RepID=UPI0022385869|nr:glutamine-hydrolyzing carbamoyl-phosphate synthase small subunit [Buchnera aphidicola]MCW5197641.1 glutamine-hydrolyzing carbamoyl-phosphate synthase small subunit [Buchnera aphidicola (Chaitophorus viminalis)]
MEEILKKKAVLILEDGSKFYGKSIGIQGIQTGEIVFNTSMTGYQEVLTDPSYKDQIITFTYPHIGNVGVNINDEESSLIHIKGLIIREISPISSNYRSTKSLIEYLKENKILTIINIDTRKLTKKIRDTGSQKGCIICLNKIPKFKNYKDILLYKNKNIKYKNKKKIYIWKEKSINIYSQKKENYCTYYMKKKNIIAYDFGIKRNILRMLKDRKCNLIVVPENTNFKDVLKLSPDGIFLSNGPGDPRIFTQAIQSIKKLIQYNIPIFGICLGHQILALANGAQIKKMKFGHHGSNHPVQNISTKKIFITSQNHNFVIKKENLPKQIKITYISLFDNTIQGIEILNKPMFSFQGHPEACPGPNDSSFLFDQFTKLVNKKKKYQRENNA